MTTPAPEPGTPVRALVVDDNVVVRAGLVALLEATGEATVIGEAGNGREAIEMAQRDRPDIVLLDVRMPVVDGVEAVEHLSRIAPTVMLTHEEDAEVIRSTLQRGAAGYLVHGNFTAELLLNSIRDAIAGGNPLSPLVVSTLVQGVRQGPEPTSETEGARVAASERPASPGAPQDARARFDLSQREAEVMELIVQGKSNAEISKELFLAEKTIKNNINRIFAKLQVTSRPAAMAKWNALTQRTE